MFRKVFPDILAGVGLIGVAYGLYGIDKQIAYIVIGGVLFVLGIIGSAK